MERESIVVELALTRWRLSLPYSVERTTDLAFLELMAMQELIVLINFNL